MTNNTLALDIGDERVGVSLAHGDLRIAVPQTTLLRNSENFWQQLTDLITNNDVTQLVLGLPRGLEGQVTEQTKAAQAFGDELASKTAIPIHWQDEALTSVKAESILRSQGKPYQKADIDAVAASLILTDYLETHKVAR